MISHANPIRDQVQSHLQFVFSPGSSHLFAALIIIEIISEAKDNKDLLYITSSSTTNCLEFPIKKADLDIYRNHNNTNVDTIEARIMNARKATYFLMGAGLHGLDCVEPDVALLEYNTHVIPTCCIGWRHLCMTRMTPMT